MVGLTVYLFGILLEEVRTTFGASVTVVAGALALRQIVNAITSVLLGRVLTRLSIRRVMVTGAVLISFGTMLLSQPSRDSAYDPNAAGSGP